MTTDLSNLPSIASFHEDILTEHFARKKLLAVMESSEKAWIKKLIHEYSLRYPRNSSSQSSVDNQPFISSTGQYILPYPIYTQIRL
jgi:hypothetical protein